MFTYNENRKLMMRKPIVKRFNGRPAHPRSHCRGSRGWPRRRFSVMQPIDIMYVKIRAAFATDRIAPKATSEPKLMHVSAKDTPMQTNIACNGCPYLTFVIQAENGNPPSLKR